MANRSLFRSRGGRWLPGWDCLNEEGAPAYVLPAREALAQYALTGCLNSTVYASAETQRDRVLELCSEVDPEYIARVALYARSQGFMKDVPALLCAVLAVRDPELLVRIFDRVIDDARMLRTFVQIIRSGAVGRRSLGTLPKRLVRQWLENRSDTAVFAGSVGNAPSLADIVKMVHPRPATATREALYGYLLGRTVQADALPAIVGEYESFKADATSEAPDVPFQMLAGLDLSAGHWVRMAQRASWQVTRMNLNTFARHGVFEHAGMDTLIAERLRDPAAIRRSRVFPYQLMAAYMNTDASVPEIVRAALEEAAELALANVPAIDGQVYVCPDVSGSMSAPVTGNRIGSTTKIRCIDVAALFAAAVLRKNPEAQVIPFEERCVDVDLDRHDHVLANAAKLAAVGGGGTNCSAPLRRLNVSRASGSLVVFISDNQSWADAKHSHGGTAMLQEWNVFARRNPGARLVCIDIQPYGTTQARDRRDILNIGGFSDRVFETVDLFARGGLQAGELAGAIEGLRI